MSVFLIISGHTEDFRYGEKTKNLTDSLDDTGNYNYLIFPYQSKGDIEKDNKSKAELIKKAFVQHRKPILWIDGNLLVKGKLSYFTNVNFDIGLLKTKSSSQFDVLFFNYTPKALSVLIDWINNNNSNKESSLVNLKKSIKNTQGVVAEHSEIQNNSIINTYSNKETIVDKQTLVIDFPEEFLKQNSKPKEKTRLHLLSLPYSITSRDKFNLCAFTSKVYNFIEMMKNDDEYELIHYGHPEAEVNCQSVGTITPEIWEKSYKEEDWKNNYFNTDQITEAYKEFNQKTPKEILKNLKSEKDGVLCFYGAGHRNCANQLSKLNYIIEPGIGYPSFFAKYTIFESKSHRNRLFTEFSQIGKDCDYNSRSFVIPGFINKKDFELNLNKSDFFLFLGRITESKGINIIIEIAKQMPHKTFIFAGPLLMRNLQFPNNCKHIGYADFNTRKELLSKAQGVLMPTLYTEPFGNVMIEAFLSGTPVISTNWGAFEENNIEGGTGFLCDTYEEFFKAIENINSINPLKCRLQGEKFSLENTLPKYKKVFDKIWNQKLLEFRH